MEKTEERRLNRSAVSAADDDPTIAAMRELDRYDPENPNNLAAMHARRGAHEALEGSATFPDEATGGPNGGGAAPNEATADSNNAFHNMIAERINPHELKGDRREAYLTSLWNAFTAKAHDGIVNSDEIIDLALLLNVDCTEDGVLDAIDEIDPSRDLDFSALCEILDRASERESDKYRELDMGHVAGEAEVLLNPLQFLWYHTPCGPAKKPNVAYRLHHRFRVELKPRMSLLLTTGFFMVLIGVVLLAVIAILWRENRFSTEEVLVTNLRTTMVELSSLYELFFYTQHEDELLDQVLIVGDMINIFFRHDAANRQREMLRTAEMVAAQRQNIATASLTAQRGTTVAQMVDAFAELSTLGVQFDTANVGTELTRLARHAGSAASAGGLPPHTGQLDSRFATLPNGTFRACESEYPTSVVIRGAASPADDLCVSHASRPQESVQLEEDVVREFIGRRVAPLLEAFAASGLLTKSTQVALFDSRSGSFPDAAVNRSCADLNMLPLCGDVVDALSHMTTAGERNKTAMRTRGFNGEDQMWGAAAADRGGKAAARSEGPHYIIMASVPYENYLLERQDVQIDSVNYLNFQFERTTEVVLGRVNKSTGEFVVQATMYRFEDGCFLECERTLPSSRNALRSLEIQGASQMITPDYRPEPVAGASNWLGDLEMVLIMERDVQEVRGLGLESLATIIDSMNRETVGSTEIELFAYDEQLYMREFDPAVPCGAGEDCFEDPRFGVFFRFDCVHCQRTERRARDTEMRLVTQPKKRHVAESLLREAQEAAAASLGAGSEGEKSQEELQSEVHDRVARQAMLGRDGIYADTLYSRRPFRKQFVDYSGERVIAESDFILNYSIGIVAKVDYNEVNGPLMRDILTSIASAVGFLVAGVVVLLLLSNHSLNKIESDWVTSKAKIEADKQRFGEMVSELIPAAVADKMMRVQSFISETSVTSIVFGDVCGFSEFTSQFSPKQVIRLITYIFSVLENVADHCRMARLCALGDTFAVYSLELSEQEAADLEAAALPPHRATPAIRGLEFACISTVLCSRSFAHFPERAKFFKDPFKERLKSTTPLEMPRLRFGAHTGSCISGVVDTGKAPKFDFFGISAALAARMCATGQPQNVHLTSMMKEMLDADLDHCAAQLVSFEEPRKTIVRGQGTITSYFLHDAAFEVPEALVQRLGVERVSVMRPLLVKERARDDRSSSVSSRPSFHSGQSESGRR